ncbi:hypothetical protein [Actinomadura hibisca]|uniref:hypothetical protein n=1 Tax=Actinomadura hibisca TaxID=68565 RepID=UPI0012F847E0|nr:hypothetical protein [Actinomadura hibisca]
MLSDGRPLIGGVSVIAGISRHPRQRSGGNGPAKPWTALTPRRQDIVRAAINNLNCENDVQGSGSGFILAKPVATRPGATEVALRGKPCARAEWLLQSAA